jgi:hypothetical protein
MHMVSVCCSEVIDLLGMVITITEMKRLWRWQFKVEIFIVVRLVILHTYIG